MAKWYGTIGYAIEEQTSPGVWIDKFVEYYYFGDLDRNTSRWSVSSDSTNDDLNINNQISILADPFAYQNFQFMKYVEISGTKWKITNVEVKYPRLVLNVGGVYK